MSLDSKFLPAGGAVLPPRSLPETLRMRPEMA